jgi:uncharacterized Fe-S cluster protein YjdI/CDGSH-type Zn-finger protein
VTTKDYAGTGITIHWDSVRCQHSGVCAATLPRVFRPAERPWIDATAANADQLADAIDQCPSGALTYTRTDGHVPKETHHAESAEATVTIAPTENGPLEVLGHVRVLAADGTVLNEAQRVYLCRCGHSENKPFCDGHHRKVGYPDNGLGRAHVT